MVKLFKATLIMPQGCYCQFKVYRIGITFWEFTNEDGLTIHIYKENGDNWTGTLSTRIGNEVQHNNLITQAIFELRDFYRR